MNSATCFALAAVVGTAFCAHSCAATIDAELDAAWKFSEQAFNVNVNANTHGNAASAAPPAPAPFRFAGAFGDGMILQAAPKQSMVWGFCPDGTKNVTVAIGSSVIQATVGPDQATGSQTTWRAALPATPAGLAEFNISASLDGQPTIHIGNVMFGEVWVCSGQSNMQYPLGSPTCWNASNINCTVKDQQCGYGCVQNAGEEIKNMANFDSGMRLFNVPHNSQATPQADVTATWQTPSAMGGSFSAMCWFFGRDMYQALNSQSSDVATTIPVGLIETNVGGTPDQHWSSPDALAKCTGTANPWDFPPGFKDSVLWNGMVVPLLRTVHSGAIWMQGEANSRADGRQYNCSFPAMISDWREKFHQYTDGHADLDFPFGWAQLNSDGAVGQYTVQPLTCKDTTQGCAGAFDQWAAGFPSIRLAESSTLSLPNTFQAVIIDTPVASGSVHSPYKQPAGQRLARKGLAMAYNRTNLNEVDPVLGTATLAADGKSIAIKVGGVGKQGLSVEIGRDGFEVLGNCTSTPSTLCWTPVKISAYEAASYTITLSSGVPAQPQALRYLWQSSPCGVNQPFHCPVTAGVDFPTFWPEEIYNHPLPLGPFVAAL